MCVDKRALGHYGSDEDWVNDGLTQYVSMCIKVKAGADFQDGTCVKSILCLNESKFRTMNRFCVVIKNPKCFMKKGRCEHVNLSCSRMRS